MTASINYPGGSGYRLELATKNRVIFPKESYFLDINSAVVDPPVVISSIAQDPSTTNSKGDGSSVKDHIVRKMIGVV